MGNYRLTTQADQEVADIYEYSILNFGLDTAAKYLTGLHERFVLLADHPSWGSDYGHILHGLCRYEYRSHSIYYQLCDRDILIVRVLGNKQDPMRQFSKK